MNNEVVKKSNLKLEISRWAWQFLLILLSMPYLYLILFFVYVFIDYSSNFKFQICLLIFYSQLYYLLSVYTHIKFDKNYEFNTAWLKSKRIYLSIIFLVFLFAIYIFGINIVEEGVIIILYFSFYILSVLYTWMLSEFYFKRLKIDNNKKFNYPIWYSLRLISILSILILWPFTWNFDILNINITLILMNIFIFITFPFYILGLISEIKHRKLKSGEDN